MKGIAPTVMLKAITREKARRSLYEFAKQAWSVLEPAEPYIDNWHVEAVCKHLEAVFRGEVTNLVINVPPGHTKSLLTSVFFPAWIWIHDSAWRGIFSSYALPLAIRDSIKTRDLVQSEWYQENFAIPGGWSLVDDQNTTKIFKNTKTGIRQALSVGSGGTGFRAKAVICDDPISAQDAYSKLKRDEVIRWWDRTMSNRLSDMRKGGRILIMQRLHVNDLTGHVLKQGGYEHLCLPSEFSTKNRSRTYVRGVLFHEDPRKEEGELLFEKRFPVEVLTGEKKRLGSDYAGQHGQRPTEEGGAIVKKTWWRFWRHDGARPIERPKEWDQTPAVLKPAKFDQIILSLDAAFKEETKSKKNSYVVLEAWGCKGADRYLLDQMRARMSFVDTKEALKSMARKWPMARAKLIEDKANGPAIISDLKAQMSGLIPIEPEGGKEVRLHAVSAQIQSGNVYLPEDADYTSDYIDEFADFPRGENDDQVDCTSQALTWLAMNSDVERMKRAFAGED
jgi:predicted phage terminase large subunit-like protein